jgi:hypothetical protein
MQEAAEQSRPEVLWLAPEICERTDTDQSVLDLEHLRGEAEEHNRCAVDEPERLGTATHATAHFGRSS